jgi:hypothetical protein
MGPYEILDTSFYAENEIPWYHVVKQVDFEHAELVNTAGGDYVGICQEYADDVDVARDRIVRVRVEGVSRAIAAGAIPLRSKVAATTNGRVAVATTGQNVVGIATTAATEAGDWLNVHITQGVVA